MPGFVAPNSVAVNTGTDLVLLHVYNVAGTRRPRVNTLVIGPDSVTPADNSAVFQLTRTTTAGTTPTGTVVVSPNDTQDAAACVGNQGTYATPPTHAAAGALGLLIGLNMRANYQWYANIGREKIGINAANNGIALVSVSANTAYGVRAALEWEE